MAKRKRLSPARADFLAGPGAAGSPSSAQMAPIATVAGDAATAAAFEQVRGELESARTEGRMVLTLPLEALQTDYLIRDRLPDGGGEEDMVALCKSLQARGQQTPIEVVDIGQGRYGLLSGWRRMQALTKLQAETGDTRFAEVKALLRRPEDQSAAYVAMVEENEIRADLSFYERARVTLRAVETGVFETEKQALQSLFSAASFAKRSKVKSFIPLVQAFDGVLHHPSRIPERLGLALSKAIIEQEGFTAQLTARLSALDAPSAGAERQCLEDALRQASATSKRQKDHPVEVASNDMPEPFLIASGIRISARHGRVELEGEGVNGGFIDRLMDWLRSQS